MKNTAIRVILLIILLLLVGLIIIILLKPSQDNNSKYSCSMDSDCVSQCRNGCVNSNWALSNPDTSECFRAWDCSCVNKQCYKDGNPQI